VDGYCWLWKRRVGKRAYGNDIQIWTKVTVPIQGCPAVRAKIKSNLTPFLADSLKDFTATLDRNLTFLEDGTTAGQSSGPPLTIPAVTDINQQRVTRRFQTERPTMTLRVPFHSLLPFTGIGAIGAACLRGECRVPHAFDGHPPPVSTLRTALEEHPTLWTSAADCHAILRPLPQSPLFAAY
jgi:hypothetical protein